MSRVRKEYVWSFWDFDRSSLRGALPDRWGYKVCRRRRFFSKRRCLDASKRFTSSKRPLDLIWNRKTNCNGMTVKPGFHIVVSVVSVERKNFIESAKSQCEISKLKVKTRTHNIKSFILYIYFNGASTSC